MTEKRKNNKCRRILALALAFVLLVATGAFGMGMHAYAANQATLYTGGGVVLEKGFKDCGNGIYKGNGVLPKNVYMSGATFAGWYKADYTTLVAGGQEVEPGQSYYAKWDVIDGMTATEGNNIAGMRMGNGFTAWMVTEESLLKGFMFFGNRGFYTSYSLGDIVPAAGATADYSGEMIRFTGTDVFCHVNEDLYVGTTIAQEGNSLARITYYVQNRGSETVDNFNLAAAADAALAGNDYVPLNYVKNDKGYSYLQMLDADAGRELRLYVDGENINKPDRLWWGSYWANMNQNEKNFIGNAFNDGMDKKYGGIVDSAFSLSWTGITVEPGETKKFSFLIGMGTPGDFTLGCTVSLKDDNGGLLQQISCENGEAYTLPTAAEAGYTGTVGEESEASWYNSDDGSYYEPGETLYISSNLELSLVIREKLEDVELNLTNGGEAVTGKQVYMIGEGICTFTETSQNGIYLGKRVKSGTWKIYIDGNNTRKEITLEKGQTKCAAEFGTALVVPKKGGNLMTGKTVSLWNSLEMGKQKYWSLAKTQEGYQVENIAPGTYYIRIDGIFSGTITVEAEKSTKELVYMDTCVDLQKDGTLWSDAKVTLKDAQGLTFDMALSDGAFKAEVPEETYQILVNGTAAEDVTLKADEAAKTLEYYTVSYYSAPDLSSSYPDLKQSVQKGRTATAPEAPKGDAEGRVNGWKNQANAAAIAENETFTVTGTTTLYRNMTVPQVVPGAYNASQKKFPDLAITGYKAGDMISGIQVNVTNGTVSAGEDAENKISGDATGALLTVLFTTAKNVEATETYLKNLTFTPDMTGDMTVTFTVYQAAE